MFYVGNVFYGNVGSEKWFDFMVVGFVVNFVFWIVGFVK